MKVGMVSPYDLGRPGGVQRQALGLTEALREMGHEVRLVAPGAGFWTGVGSTMAVPINGSRAPIALGPAVPGRVIRALEDVDVVHVHEPFVPAVGPSALAVQRPAVTTFHADPSRLVRSAYRVGSGIIRWGLRDVAVTAVSPVAASAIDAAGVHPQIIPNAVDHPAATAAERFPHRVVFVGRDERRKGLDALLEAWPGVQARVPDAELTVVGARRSPQPGVSWLGSVDEASKWLTLTSGTVGVAPNLHGESFGIVVAEMLVAGLAVVASDLPAFRHVSDGAALLVAPGDSGRLAEAIVELLATDELRSVLTQRAGVVAARYRWETVAERYVSAYRAVGTNR